MIDLLGGSKGFNSSYFSIYKHYFLYDLEW